MLRMAIYGTVALMVIGTVSDIGAAVDSKHENTVQDIHIWPDKVPLEKSPKADAEGTGTNGRLTRISKVTDPLLTVFSAKNSRTDAAVIVCPGGGYSMLSMRKEGYEIAGWLNRMGFTAFVLQYRVPKNPAGALCDAQRAWRVVHSRAKEWGINPNKIGMIGFSAGGSLTARTCCHGDEPLYKAVDAADAVPVRPAFAMLIYPAYLDKGAGHSLTPEIKISAHTPPMFMFATADDHYSNSAIVMAGALRQAKISVEMHLYPKGGHGYGLRGNNVAGRTWPDLAQKWLQSMSLIPKKQQ